MAYKNSTETSPGDEKGRLRVFLPFQLQGSGDCWNYGGCSRAFSRWFVERSFYVAVYLLTELESALDPASPYYDEKATHEDPKWDVVHVEFRQKFPNMITLNDLKAHSAPGRPLESLQTLKQSRLSVSSVTPGQWKFIMRLVEEKPGSGSESSSKDEESEDESSEE